MKSLNTATENNNLVISISEVSAFYPMDPGGLEVSCKIDNKNYRLFLQLPDCPDSRHHVIEGDELSDDKIQEVIDMIEEEYSSLTLTANEHAIYDFEVKEVEHDDEDYTVIIDKDKDNPTHLVVQESKFSSYYNVELYEVVTENKDEIIEKALNEK